MDRRTYLLLASVTFALLAACTKTESEAPSPPASATTAPAASSATPTTASATPTAASASATASAASAAPTASAAAPAPEDTAKTAAKEAADAPKAAPPSPEPPKTATSGGAAAPAASASAAPAQCGTKPLPDCPLQAWMKANVNPPVLASDTAALATALDKVVGLAPTGYANWASIAKDGAAAARSGDLAAAKASCRTCHDQYKAKYKNEIRARKI